MRYVLGGLTAAFLTISSGCIVVGSSNPTVVLDLTFAGSAQCPSDVSSVQVTEANNGFPQTSISCAAGGTASVSIADVPPATYTVQLVGLQGGATTWSANEQIIVTQNGANVFHIDLLKQTDQVLFDFEFGAPAGSMSGGLTCDQAKVMTLDITVDPGTPSAAVATGVPCHDATSGRDSALISNVMPGVHSFDVAAQDGQGNVLWDAMITDETVSASNMNEFVANLQPVAPGSLQLQWTFGPNMVSCADAGVMSVTYQLTAPDGTPLSPGTAPCLDGSNQPEGTIQGLTAGNYTLNILQGCNGAGTCYNAPVPVSNLLVLPGQIQAYSVNLQ